MILAMQTWLDSGKIEVVLINFLIFSDI